jgi:cell wall-associated protease
MSFKKNCYSIFLISLPAFCLAQVQPLTSKKQTLPSNWHYLSAEKSGYYGVNAEQAHQFLDSLQLKPKKITVAVIDADLNINHEDLKERIWKNPNPGAAGYANDLNGWNFLGHNDGRMLIKTGTEAFREYKRLRPKYENIKADAIKKKAEKEEYAYFLHVRKEAKINSYVQFGAYLKAISDAFVTIDSLVKSTKFDHQPKVADVLALQIEDTRLKESFRVVSSSMYKYRESDLWEKVLAAQVEESSIAMKRINSLDDKAVPRDLIGDKLQLKDKYYGNATLYDPESYHGTFVAGLIAAERNNGLGIDGIADSVAIMGIRAVPDGDEYDKDVALAIYYAVDHGAKLINMSFGKYISPNSKWVNDAIKYAAKKNVLLFHAAGNDGKNIDSVMIYPSGMQNAKKRIPNLIRVGASTPSGDAAAISNYGVNNVDLFAPGTSIHSTGLNNGYQTANGTSLSAPITTGIAALLWSYFPELKATDIKNIMMATVTSREGVITTKPGKGKNKTEFEKLCASGGIVNAYQAVKMAHQLSMVKK